LTNEEKVQQLTLLKVLRLYQDSSNIDSPVLRLRTAFRDAEKTEVNDPSMPEEWFWFNVGRFALRTTFMIAMGTWVNQAGKTPDHTVVEMEKQAGLKTANELAKAAKFAQSQHEKVSTKQQREVLAKKNEIRNKFVTGIYKMQSNSNKLLKHIQHNNDWFEELP
jgi:hypothetical protein